MAIGKVTQHWYRIQWDWQQGKWIVARKTERGTWEPVSDAYQTRTETVNALDTITKADAR